MHTINATQLARHTREVLDAVAAHGEVVAIERNHRTIARIVPAEPMMSAAQAIAGLAPGLTRAQAEAWLRDSREEFDERVGDPWG